jgi:hypothetical protein
MGLPPPLAATIARLPKISKKRFFRIPTAWLNSQVFYSDVIIPVYANPTCRECERKIPMLSNLKVMFVVVVVVVLAVSAYAFAAANTVPATKAGAGSGIVSGYTVTNVDYNLNATDPTILDSVDFTLSAAATTVKIKLVAAGSTWYDCALVSGMDWTCDTTTPSISVATIDQLDVVAAE